MQRSRIAALFRLLLPVALASLLVGCGEKDLIDDSKPSEAQIRSLIEQFQSAAANQDDDAACNLMDDQMRENTEGTNALVDGKLEVLPCGVTAALWNPQKELRSLPSAGVVYVVIDRHDQTADVQLDDGTRFRLRRAGENADGEWRIDSMGYRPSPDDWKDELRLKTSVSADALIGCLTDAGFQAKPGGVLSGGNEKGSFNAGTIQIGSAATVLVLGPTDAARVQGAIEPRGRQLRNPFGERVAANAYVRAPVDPGAPINFRRPAGSAPEQIHDQVVNCVG
jgi:hypothetical protein